MQSRICTRIFFVAAAFFVSLWQMKKSNTVAQMTQYQGALQLMLDWRADIITDPELVNEYGAEEYFKKAFGLLPTRRYFHTIKLPHIFEHCWLLNNRGVFPIDMWQPWSNNIFLLMKREKEKESFGITSRAPTCSTRSSWSVSMASSRRPRKSGGREGEGPTVKPATGERCWRQ